MAATRFRLTQLFSNNLQLIGVRSSTNLHQPNIRQHHICTNKINLYNSSRFAIGNDSGEYLHGNSPNFGFELNFQQRNE